MIDFHSHILPNVDDGSSSFEMSLEMINNSIQEGVKSICATPHFISGEYEIQKEEYIKKITALQEHFKNKGINICSGLELYINPDLPRLFHEDKLWGLNNSRYVLVELPMRDFPIYTEKVFYDLRLQGLIPILAHPERNFGIMKNLDLLINLIEQGNLAQMNAGSLIGSYGKDIKLFAEKLVEMNLIHVLGSDGHNNKNRITRIKKGFEIIDSINSKLSAWIVENESRILEDEEVDVLEIKEVKKKKGFFGLLHH